MLKIMLFSLLFLALSCKSTGGTGSRSKTSSIPEIEFIPKQTDATRAAAAQPTPALPKDVVAVLPTNYECKPEDAPQVPQEEANVGYRCETIKYDDQLIADSEQINAWANSLRQAQLELFKATCAKKIDYARLTISCHPNGNEGSCPALFEDCDQESQPSRCFAEAYQDQDLTIASRPQAWGDNECDARNKLRKKACAQGLDPQDLKNITCEREPSPTVCPPIWKNCASSGESLTECSIRKTGAVTLDAPIKAIGSGTCEATYRAKELACRMQTKKISEISGIQCYPVTNAASKTIAAPNPPEGVPQ